MQKSIVIAREEFKEAMANLINGSGLPFFVVADVLSEMKREADGLARRQYQMELEALKNAEAEDKEKTEEEDDADS